jgi:hypothetical protein
MLSNLEKGELIDVLTAGTVTTLGQVANAGLVTGKGMWAFEKTAGAASGELSWFDSGHGVEHLTLQFASSGNANIGFTNDHTFKVV